MEPEWNGVNLKPQLSTITMIRGSKVTSYDHIDDSIVLYSRAFVFKTDLFTPFSSIYITNPCFPGVGWRDQLLAALSDLLPCNRVKVPGMAGPTGGHPASPQMVGRSDQAAGMEPLTVCTHSHTQQCRLWLCALTARTAPQANYCDWCGGCWNTLCGLWSVVCR